MMPDVWPFGDGEPACCGSAVQADALCLLALALRPWWRWRAGRRR
jgi:hypothetical protein